MELGEPLSLSGNLEDRAGDRVGGNYRACESQIMSERNDMLLSPYTRTVLEVF